MVDDGSVTEWIEKARRGDARAAEQLWARYFPQLVHLARRKLDRCPRRIADEEDVAAAAFQSFCRAAQEGRVPDIKDRHSLWRLLMRITSRKAIDLKRYNRRLKRRVFGESVLGETGDDDLMTLDRLIGRDPTPEFAAIVAESCRELLSSLGDPHLQSLALAKLDGLTNLELAARFDCSVRTVERRLHLVRRKWEAVRLGGSEAAG